MIIYVPECFILLVETGILHGFPGKKQPKVMDPQEVSEEELEHRDMLMEQRIRQHGTTSIENSVTMWGPR